METEAQQYRETLSQKHSIIKTLERKVASLEVEVTDLQQKNNRAAEEQHKLAAEKNALIDTVRKLNRDLAKLDSFKKNLLQSLNDDAEVSKSEPSMSAINLASERLVAEALNSAATSSGISYVSATAPGANGHQSSGSSGFPYPSTPTRSFTPPETSFAPSVPPASTSGNKLDGKEFFRLARSRLSSDQFSLFLQIIKDLNAGRQTRDQTLKRARDVLGISNADLYGMFEALLSRQINAL